MPHDRFFRSDTEFDEVYPGSYNKLTTFLGFPTLKLKGGKYARVKLEDWNDHADEIGPIFDALMEEYKKDPAGPTVEFYRSQKELYLMIPISEN